MLISIQNKYLQLIKKGEKTVEGRINFKEYTMLKVGSTIIFQSDCDKVTACVTSLKPYNSFQEMIEEVGCRALLPHVNSTEEGVSIYRSFPNYKEREKKYGCLAIHISIQ